MRRMPTLGQPHRKKSPLGKMLLFSLLLGAGAGAVWWKKFRPPEPPPIAADTPAPSAEPPATEPAATAVASAPAAAGPRSLSIQINGPLETSVVEVVGRDLGPALAQVVTRALVWWIDVPGDFRKGDKLDVLYEERAGEEPLVHAVRFSSSKLGQLFSAYRFQAPGDSFPRMYQVNGEELEQRLTPTPLDDYEQVTSLIRDGRRHKGVDFKTPVGTPVKATFAGVITRKNWNWRSNGNCLEVTDPGTGRKALYLHLSELPKALHPGEHVTLGEVIAQSGNSGHSFAPHLHYQLMLGEERVLDPFATHQTLRKALAPEAKAALAAEVARLDGRLVPPVAAK